MTYDAQSYSFSLSTDPGNWEMKKEWRQRWERERKPEINKERRTGRARERESGRARLKGKKQPNWISCHTAWWTISDWLSAAGPLGNYPDSWVAVWDEEAGILHSLCFSGHQRKDRKIKNERDGKVLLEENAARIFSVRTQTQKWFLFISFLNGFLYRSLRF